MIKRWAREALAIARQAWWPFAFIAILTLAWFATTQAIKFQDEVERYRELLASFPAAVEPRSSTRMVWLKAGVVNGMKVYVVMEEDRRGN